MVIKQKTKQETVLIRKEGLKIKNRDAQNDGFSSISIRLSKRAQTAVSSSGSDHTFWTGGGSTPSPGVPRQQTATLNLSTVEESKDIIFCRF